MRTVIVTGASGKLGLAIAERFASLGVNLLLHYRTHSTPIVNFVSSHPSLRIIPFQADLTDATVTEKLINTAVSTFGSVDVLVNNAGTYTQTDEWNSSVPVWQETLNNNLISVLNTSKYAALQFQRQHSGCIVNIASRKALFGHSDEIAYSAAKAGVLNLTQSYARLLSPFARVNAVCPGATDSGYWLTAPKSELKATLSASPHNRLVAPEEVAAVVEFFASPAAAMITGQWLLIDGGKSLF